MEAYIFPHFVDKIMRLFVSRLSQVGSRGVAKILTAYFEFKIDRGNRMREENSRSRYISRTR